MPTPIPWQLILLHPLGLVLLFSTTIFFIFFLLFTTKTPAMTFLKAGFGRKMILINPDEDKRMVFRIAKKKRSLAHVKDKGYYLVDPNHVHIEAASKLPIAITYGNFGVSLDSETAALSKKLQEMKIKNWVEIVSHFTETLTSEQALKRELITKEQHDLQPEKMYSIRKTNAKDIVLNGETVPFDNIVNYFSKNVRADLIESEIQWRTSMNTMAKLTRGGDIFKWAVILVIILIGAALAYNMIMMGRPEPAQTAATGVGGYVQTGVEAVSGTGLS